MTSKRAAPLNHPFVALVVFISASVILYAPSTARGFSSDDYCILHYLISTGRLLVPGFFRPVGDMTLKWTYQIFGWDPFYFYLINIVLHGLNSFLVFVLCRKLYSPGGAGALLFAFAAGALFLTYHSHGEAVLWAIGRGISLAVFFSLLAMIAMVSNISFVPKLISVCGCYLVALACYESVLFLPLALLLAGRAKGNLVRIKAWSLWLSVTLCLSLLMRYYFTGSLWGGYNGVIFSRSPAEYFTNFIKIAIRVFVPPVNHPVIFVLSGVAVALLLSILIIRARQRLNKEWLFVRIFFYALGGLLASLLVCLFFGISTRTSEGDRLLYLPSVFLAVLVAGLILRVPRSLKVSAICLAVVVFFQAYFVLRSQENWVTASEYSNRVIAGIASNPLRPLYIINLPEDYKGAYIFRNCLPQALLQHGVDTAGIVILSKLGSTEAEEAPAVIIPERKPGHFFIWPRASLPVERDSVSIIKINEQEARAPLHAVMYWDKEFLRPLDK